MSAPTQPALNGIVLALNTDQPGVMYVGGNFTDAGGDPNADYIARWDGTTWQALGTTKLNGQVTAIAYRNRKIYAGGTLLLAVTGGHLPHLSPIGVLLVGFPVLLLVNGYVGYSGVLPAVGAAAALNVL